MCIFWGWKDRYTLHVNGSKQCGPGGLWLCKEMGHDRVNMGQLDLGFLFSCFSSESIHVYCRRGLYTLLMLVCCFSLNLPRFVAEGDCIPWIFWGFFLLILSRFIAERGCTFSKSLFVVFSLNLPRFIAEGGWDLLNLWLNDAKTNEHNPVIMELIRVFKELPVTIDILKKVMRNACIHWRRHEGLSIVSGGIYTTSLNPNKTGGPWWPPLDILCDNSATRKALATTLYVNFLSSFPHMLTPNLWRPGVRFRSYITFCKCMSDRKRLKMWFCVQNQCKLSFFT